MKVVKEIVIIIAGVVGSAAALYGLSLWAGIELG